MKQPKGILGPITTIPNAGQINSLVDAEPASRDTEDAGASIDRKARSLTDKVDADPSMPDALEVAAAQDREFASTGKLVGPLHGVVMAIKDQYDTFDMRTTSGADAFYANDRPPEDSTFVRAPARRGRDHPREVESRRVRLGHSAQLVRRHVLQSVRHRAQSARIELGLGILGRRESRDLCDRRGNRLIDSWPGQRGEQRRHRGHPGTRESQGHGADRHQHARRSDLSQRVEDAARVLDVIAGYDPKDELTVFSIGRTPPQPYESFAQPTRLDGVRIGVVREYMNKKLFTKADEQTIDIVSKGAADLRKLGATIVDPGPEGDLFTSCLQASTCRRTTTSCSRSAFRSCSRSTPTASRPPITRRSCST